MGYYNSVSIYKITRGVASIIDTINLSQRAGSNHISYATSTNACTPREPKCDKPSTFYTVFDKFGNEMFTTDVEGWTYITGKGGYEVSSYLINRGVAVNRNSYFTTTNAYNNFPMNKQVLACSQKDPKCEKEKPSPYYTFFNISNKPVFTTDQEGFDILNGGGAIEVKL